MTDAFHDQRGVVARRAGLPANHALRFALEVVALAALSYWGFHAGRGIVADTVLGVGASVLAAVVWGVFAAPKSDRRLRGGPLLGVQTAVFAAAAAAIAATGHAVLAATFAATVVLNAVLLHILEGEDRS